MEQDEMTYAEWVESAIEMTASEIGLDPSNHPPDTFLRYGRIYNLMRVNESQGLVTALYRKEDGSAVEVYFV